MATSELPQKRAPEPRRGVWHCSAARRAVLLAVLAYRSRPPQMGPDEEVFNTVDAPCTPRCETGTRSVGASAKHVLKAYREAGKPARRTRRSTLDAHHREGPRRLLGNRR